MRFVNSTLWDMWPRVPEDDSKLPAEHGQGGPRCRVLSEARRGVCTRDQSQVSSQPTRSQGIYVHVSPQIKQEPSMGSPYLVPSTTFQLLTSDIMLCVGDSLL
jgi:hypothetical protein